jgi:phosphate transport system protein
MREDYAAQLDAIGEELNTMCDLVGSAVAGATKALLEGDLGLAEQVIDADAQINDINAQIDEQCFRIAARQAPVATDLRLVMSAVRMASSLERMGDLASHIAKQVRLRYPSASIPEELKGTFAEMGEAAQMIVAATSRVISTRDTDLAKDISSYDDKLDNLHRMLFTTVLSPDWKYGVEAAIDITLLSRFYERFGDHAVTVARRVVHIVTGEPYTK